LSALGKAQLLASRGKFVAAEQLLHSSASSDLRAPLVLGRILEQQDRTPDALASYDQARVAHPEHAPAHLFYAIAALDLNKVAEARQALQRTLELQPRNDVALSYSALCDLMTGNDDAAVTNFRTHGITDNRAFRVRLSEWMELQWLANGRFFAQAPVSLPGTPSPAKPSTRKAQKHFYAKRYAEMMHELDAATRLDMQDQSVLFACALGAEMLFDYERALEYLARVKEPESEWPDALIAARGRSRVRLGDFAGGAGDLGRALAVGPEDYGTNYYLGLLCLAHNERSRARQLLLRAHTQYVIDTIDFQWWQIERALGLH
jgi:tetratricopeptide (TPR) repeat protein